jgi:transcriptional regulator with XRE-family HTH domain
MPDALLARLACAHAAHASNMASLKRNLEIATERAASLRKSLTEFVNSHTHSAGGAANLSAPKNKHQALLRLDSEHFDLCSSSNFSAASPRGADDLPCSISLTAEGERSQYSPISAKVIPFGLRRRSVMRDAHVVMGTTLRKPVIRCQRQTVTEFRENSGMPRPLGLPRFAALGPRIRWWREYRNRDRREFARTVGIPYSTLADLENERANSTKKLRKIADELNLRLEYLETDEGEPELSASPTASEWPLPGIPRERLEKLTRTERELLAFKLRDILNDIEADRPATRKTG